MQTTITSKGQVTIPKPVRDALHLSAGDRVEFLVEPDGTIKVIPVTASVTELKGIVPPQSFIARRSGLRCRCSSLRQHIVREPASKFLLTQGARRQVEHGPRGGSLAGGESVTVSN